MPAGESLANEVAKLLDSSTSKSVAELAGELEGAVTIRAVRYAVKLLVEAGRARLTGNKVMGSRQRYRVLAVLPEEASREPAAATG